MLKYIVNFSWSQLEYPLVICPPMDGITDMAYRELIAEMGGAGPMYCEFVNVKGLIYQNPKTIFELRFTDKQFPVLAQLFGHEPEEFYQAAKLVIDLGFPAIDINMGCPAHKVASKGGGCALMGNTSNAKKIVEETIRGANEKSSTPIEVSCKMRLGIDRKDTVFEHGMAMVEAGAKVIAIHGRTLKQMYTGEADWEPIKQFNNALMRQFTNEPEKKPKVFGSGDVNSLYEALVRILTTGVDGVMIGRGSFGNPWVFEKKRVDLMRKYLLEIQNAFGKNSGEFNIEEIESYKDIEKIRKDLENYHPDFDELSKMVIHHAKLMEADKGQSGIVQMRKHLGWYFVGFDGAKDLRSALVRSNSIGEIEEILNNFRTNVRL